MLEYLIVGGAGVGIAVAVGLYLYERRLMKENVRECEKNERAYEELMVILNDIEKKEEISKLVTCLNNYLYLRTKAEL